MLYNVEEGQAGVEARGWTGVAVVVDKRQARRAKRIIVTAMIDFC